MHGLAKSPRAAANGRGGFPKRETGSVPSGQNHGRDAAEYKTGTADADGDDPEDRPPAQTA